jgi:hypothetical protein
VKTALTDALNNIKVESLIHGVSTCGVHERPDKLKFDSCSSGRFCNSNFEIS